MQCNIAFQLFMKGNNMLDPQFASQLQGNHEEEMAYFRQTLYVPESRRWLFSKPPQFFLWFWHLSASAVFYSFCTVSGNWRQVQKIGTKHQLNDWYVSLELFPFWTHVVYCTQSIINDCLNNYQSCQAELGHLWYTMASMQLPNEQDKIHLIVEEVKKIYQERLRPI